MGKQSSFDSVQDELEVSAEVVGEFVHVYVHKMLASEHTRKTCSSLVIKLFALDKSEAKPGWSKTKLVTVGAKEIHFREILKIDSVEGLHLEVLENSSWISGRVRIFLINLGTVMAENGNYLHRHWISLTT